MNKPAPKIRATPRAIRVAYILENGDDSHRWLDAIFADCFSRDGGRQSPIIPVHEGQISTRFKSLLRLHDPDYVFLITYENQGLIEELSALLQDAVLLAKPRDKEKPEKHPNVSLENSRGLTALSWLPYLKTVTGFHRSSPTKILDCHPHWEDDGLIKDNFGTLYGSGFAFPLYDQIDTRGLVLTPSSAPTGGWRLPPTNSPEVQDAYAILEQLGNRKGTTTLAQLSNLNSQTYKSRHPWTQGFCLVVGDTYEDRILCWNAGLLFEGAQNQPYKTLRLPLAATCEPRNVDKIAAFLLSENWLGQRDGQPIVFVRSHSLKAKDLDNFVTRLRETSRSSVTFEATTSMDDCCPQVNAEREKERDFFHFSSRTRAPVETHASSTSTPVTVPQPMQLAYCAGLHPEFSIGTWFVDCAIDRINDVGRFDNVREVWMLPRKRQLVDNFCSTQGAQLKRYGILSVPATVSSRVIEIRQPDDALIFRDLFVKGPFFDHHDARRNLTTRPKYGHVEPSDKGSYLQGLVGMFGSLSELEMIMGTHFWRKQFARMAAPAESQHDEVIRDIQRRMNAQNGRLVIEGDADWNSLAQRILQKASRLRVPRLSTKYEALLKAWTSELDEAIKSSPDLEARRVDFERDHADELKRSLSHLFERGVMYRGHEWVCSECRHRNWRGVDALKDRMACEVCGDEHSLPVDVALDFRVNEFFATCIREHDTITVAWALCALRRRSERSFMYAPQTALYTEEEAQRPERELDLVCIVDGKFVIGEVKADVKLIKKSDIEDLAAAVTKVGADIAVLAALRGDHTLMEAKLRELKALLPTRIETTSFISDWDERPSLYL